MPPLPPARGHAAGRRRFVDAETRKAGLVGRGHHGFRFAPSAPRRRAPRCRRAPLATPLHRLRPDRRQVETAVLPGLWRLHQDASPAGEAIRPCARNSATRATSRPCLPPPRPPGRGCRQTTAAWPTSNGPIASSRCKASSRHPQADPAMGLRRDNTPSGTRISGRDFVRAEQAEAVLLEQSSDAGEQWSSPPRKSR